MIKKVKSTQKQLYSSYKKRVQPSLAALNKMTRVKKLKWRPRNNCDGRSMAKFLITTIQVNFVLIPSEAGITTQIGLNCCY